MHPPMLPVLMTPVRAMQLQPSLRTRPEQQKQSPLARWRLLLKQTRPVTMEREGGRNGDPGIKDGAGLYAIFSQNGGRGNAATNVANTGSTRQAATTRGDPSGSRIGNSNQGIVDAAGISSGEEGIQTEQAGGVGGQTPNAKTGGEDGQGDKDGEGGPPIPAPASPTQWTEAQLRQQDSKPQSFTAADWRLMSIYHDTVHHNDGSHLHGPISEGEDQLW